MSLGSHAIGAQAFGAVEEVAAAVAAGTITERKARFVMKRLRLAFKRRGFESCIYMRGAQTHNVRTVWAMTRSEELAGEVRQSDMTVFIDAQSFEGASLTLPLKNGDKLTRWPDLAREHVYTTLETPALYTIGEYDVLYRLIVRG